MMNSLKVPSLQSLLESDRGSNDSLLAESLQLDIEDLDDIEYSIPVLQTIPTLENVLTDLDGDSDIYSESGLQTATPTPSMDEQLRTGTILRHIVLQGITVQIGSAADRVNAGLASSVAVSNMTAIGTSHGHILAFDSQQTLRWCCQEHTVQGAVSALAFNEDCTRLLAGFARGHIIMIDTSTGDAIRSMSDVITPNSGVLNLRWTESSTTALCSDSGGSVWTLNFTRRLGIRGCDSRCIFSGARGEVCAVEPLCFGDIDHPLKSYCIAAMATLSKFVVVTVKPRLKVIKFHQLPGPPECLPLLAWQMVLIQSSDSTRVIDPVLCAARGSSVYFHQISWRHGRVSLLFLRHITQSYSLLALHWLGPKTIACIDQTEILHLYDVRMNKELECIDMATAGLVYGSAQFKGFATGGNVSPALALAGTYACYNSVISHGARLYILGARSLHSVTVRAWSDRISYLVANQRWHEACALAIDGFKAAGERHNRKLIAKDRILQLIDEYVTATARCPELCLEAIMNCLIEIQEFDTLWQELWERLPVKDTYLLHLTEHIDRGQLGIIAPAVAQSLCDYWLRMNPERLEEIILKLDWRCLDLHQVLKASRKEKLFNAQIYLNTHALGDYCVSLTDLVPLILEEDRKLGNYLLVYVSSCLAGRGYPTGVIADDMIATVKHEVLRCLTSIHSNGAAETELSYPYLRALLQFDTRDTLNVLSLAFQEKEFAGQLGQSHRQRIVNILLEIMTPNTSTWSHISCLLNFIAQQISSRSLPDEPALLAKVVHYLRMENIDEESVRQHSEREQAWLELLDTDCLSHIPLGEQLQMAKSARCYRVAEHLLEKRHTFDGIVACYLQDATRHLELWNYMRKHARNEKRVIYAQILANFETLLQIDTAELTRIVVEYFSVHIGALMRLLDGQNELLYRFMEQLQRHHFALESQDAECYLTLLCQFSAENVDAFLRSADNYRLDVALDIVIKYELFAACIYLYEKKGDYQAAFDMSLDLLREAPESVAEARALDVSQLCSRASQQLNDAQRERLWFGFITVILPRPDLTQITRNILQAASGHVDLSKLVQLIMQTGEGTAGNFGDIKHLLLGMLSNSRYETLLLQTTAKVLGTDLHQMLAKEKRTASQGLAIKSIKCVVCRQCLYRLGAGGGGNVAATAAVLVFGACGHAVHKECCHRAGQCPRCGAAVQENGSITLPEPNGNNEAVIAPNAGDHSNCILQLSAPPRIGIGGQ